VYQWCEFKSRRGKNKNLTALKSNFNAVCFNFQTYIYPYGYTDIYIVVSYMHLLVLLCRTWTVNFFFFLNLKSRHIVSRFYLIRQFGEKTHLSTIRIRCYLQTLTIFSIMKFSVPRFLDSM
jgi:hypothetical protein